MQQLNNTSALQGQQHKRLPSRLILSLFFLLPLMGWGQSLPFEVTTPDDVTNHTEKFYWIESVGATGFYAVPHSNNTNASTTNAPTLRALWYFMESGESGYYYIINKETLKYLKKTGNAGTDNTIQVATYDSADDVKFKFSFDTPQGITQGSWVIYPKDAGGAGWVGKQSGNLAYDKWLKVANWNNTPVGDLNAQWFFVARADVQWPKSGLPFVVSTNSDKHYYNINHAQSPTYNVSYDGSNYVTISTAIDDKKAWYFVEAATDANIDNLKYYKIVNAQTEKYLKFTATTINGSNQNDKFILSDYDEGDADRFQFVVVNSYGGNAGYSIMPKLAMSKFGDSNRANSMVPASVANNEKLDLRSDRNNSNAHWNFIPTIYPSSCSTPTITYSIETGEITITTTTTGAEIHYTTDGVTVPSSTVGTLYNEPFAVSSPMTIMAIATKTGYADSEVATATFDQVATPGFELTDDAKVRLTCATSGASIYYAMGTTQPTSVTIDPSNLYSGPIENAAGKYIAAVAVKDGLWINSTLLQTGQITFPCAKPVIRKTSPTTFTITCSFPSGAHIRYNIGENHGVPDDPTPTSGYEYNGAVTFNESDLPFTVKAIAYAAGYDPSAVATQRLTQDLTLDSDGFYVIASYDNYETFVSMVNENDENAAANYKITADINVYGAGVIDQYPFTGELKSVAKADGTFPVVSGLSHAIFNTVNNGKVHDIMLKNIEVSGSGNVGAICNEAKGYTRIYNCGILPTNPDFSESTRSSVASTDSGSAGGIVGLLDDDSRVVNCFSYADVSSTGYAAGIVGNNTFASTAEVENVSGTDKYTHLRTMVVNCMFYGDITAGSTVWPVYGGTKITNAGATAINNYNFYSDSCHFSTPLETSHKYYCSWPAKYDYLTRYEFLRYLLNSNRELCGWWVGAPEAPSTMATTAVQAVPKDASLMSKWVLDRSVAPYPILKAFGTYSSPINIDADAEWRRTANKWEGKKLGTLSVNINPGTYPNNTSPGVSEQSDVDFVITDMDTIHGDYCYRKIQLPYYNEVFGNPDGDTWDAKYGGNYKDYVVTGWDITSVTGGTTGVLVEDWENGYNFADRNCTDKDTHRTFAQGGYYYVPNGVSAITITAHWGNAVYMANGDNYYDRVDFNHTSNKPGTAFAPAGTRSATLGNGKTVYTDKIATVAENLPDGGTVYDNAIVLVGNHQFCTGNEDVNPSKNFTIMSADFDLDNEPDYCLEWQLGLDVNRYTICPIRFDFLPVVEIGLCLKKDGSTQYYSLGCYRPMGHYEVTETALIRFGQFEFSRRNRTEYAPIILNGGIFEQYVKGHQSHAFTGADDKITYVIIGGNVYMPSFTPGAHVNERANYPTRHCAVNAIGGKFDYLYLTGNYNEGVTPNNDDPHCYIDGGWFGQIAAAGKEGIGLATATTPKGNVTFKINHARIKEFYGGSTLADKRVTGNIDVTIDSSRVMKYCGGPKFGDLYLYEDHPENNKTVTTSATGTIFTSFYGGGNGGTSYVQYHNTDGEKKVDGYDWYIEATTSNGGSLNPDFYVAGSYRDETNEKAPNTYEADYDMSIVNVSTGTHSGYAVFRTYFYAAQFSATNTGTVTNELTGCKVLENFYGGGFLGGVKGNVNSTLTDTEVYGSAFGAGYSASVPTVDIYELGTPPTGKTPPTIDVYTGIITPQSGGTKTTYTWTNETSIGGHTLSETTPTFEGCEYFYTNVPLSNLGTVTGNVTLTIKGNSVIGTGTTGDVFGGGAQSDVEGNTTVKLQDGTQVRGNVYGGGDQGAVGGDSEVLIQDE